MSDLDDAAVGEAFGTFARVGRGDADAIDVDLQLLGHDLRHLDEQALAHLGAAVVQHQRAVGIDVQQASRLVAGAWR